MSRRDGLVGNSSPGARIFGAVLVGGRSSRMGRDKATLPHPAGGTFLDHAIQRLHRLGIPVAVAGLTAGQGPAAAHSGGTPAVTYLADAPHDPGRSAVPGQRTGEDGGTSGRQPAEPRGPVAGIVSALRWAGAAGAGGVLVTPVDMPLLTSDPLRQMLVAFAPAAKSHPERREEPLVATFDQRHREPLVAIYPLEMLAPLERLAASEDRSLYRWLARQPHRMHPLPPTGAANVNTPEQYAEHARPAPLPPNDSTP